MSHPGLGQLCLRPTPTLGFSVALEHVRSGLGSHSLDYILRQNGPELVFKAWTFFQIVSSNTYDSHSDFHSNAVQFEICISVPFG